MASEILLDPVHDWDHALGPNTAPLTLVEYGDYECPDCGRLFILLCDLQEESAARLRLVYRHYPLSGIHKHAETAAEAAELFENQAALEKRDLERYAEKLDLDVARFQNELTNGNYYERVRQNFIAGVRNGVNQTPGLFLNGIRQGGAFDEQSLRKMLGL